LDALADRAAHLETGSELDQLNSDFRGELRVYRDRLQTEVDQLRREVAQTVEAMQNMIGSVAQSGGDHEQTLRREFQALDQTVQSGDLGAIRSAIHHAAETALKSCEEIRRAREVVIAQLQDEIRNLHRTVDRERHAMQTDAATGLWSRAKLDSRIKDLILLNEGFSVFLAGVVDFAEATHEDVRLVPGSLASLAGRLQNLAGKDGEIGMAGRWSEEIFAILFKLPLTGVPITPRAMQRSLSGDYAIQTDGVCQTVRLDIHVRAVERVPDGNESTFYLQLGQAAFSVIAH
jgi:GGDEF domain-containing protein